LIGNVFIKDTGAFVEVFRRANEAFDIATRVYPCISIRLDSGLENQFFVGNFRRRRPQLSKPDAYNAYLSQKATSPPRDISSEI
jgi:hypothetical protein